MAYSEIPPTDQPAAKSSGVVVPLLDARGNPYPESLRVQQVGLRVARAVRDRIDRALAGGPIRLRSVHLGESGKAHLRTHLLAALLPELYADPIPAAVRPARRIVSPKAVSLLDDRLGEAFNPPGGVLDLPGVRLTPADLFDLLALVRGAILGVDDTGLADEWGDCE